MNDVLAQAYPSRIEAIEALRCSPAKGDVLHGAAVRLSESARLFGRAEAAGDWRALAIALEIVALLTDWELAVRRAEADADRYLRAARLSYADWSLQEALPDFANSLIQRLAPIQQDILPNRVVELRDAIASLPMPLSLLSEPEIRSPFDHLPTDPKPAPEDVAVAFLEFTIDGRPAETLHSLSAGQVHDLDLSIRVSRWPADATSLRITPVSVEPPSSWDFPTFEFERPSGEAPHVFQRRARMTVHAAQGFHARPLEFRYAAQFEPPVARDQKVVVAGQRTLRLNGTDTSRHPVTGYGEMDDRIVLIREALRSDPLVSERDLADLLAILAPVGNLMGQAVQDKRYPEPIDETAFQRDFQTFLRAHGAIGSELEVQPQVAGGRSDLSFRGIRIELKSEQKTRLLPDDCRKYAEQAASYAVGTGKRIALLCVLDCSPKTTMPFPAADGLQIMSVDTGTSSINVICCLLQGNFVRPSDLSR